MTRSRPIPEDIETRLFIDNQYVPALSGRTFGVIDPSTEQETVQVHEADVDDVNRAVKAAQKALPAWRDMGGFTRATLFYRLADLLDEHNGELAQLEAVSMGRPVGTYTEGHGAARYLRYVAGKATDIQGESSLQTPGFLNVTVRQPYGVCAAITPWNAPITMLSFKLGPALIAGNTLVVKSSEKAPLTSLYLGRLIVKAGFPPGVVNILSGYGLPCGNALASHMDIRKLSFTGSVGTGKLIKKAAAASNLKNVTVELGGKSPLLIFEDADLDKAAAGAARSILLNSGQACIASSRVYIQGSVAQEFSDKLVAILEESGANPPSSCDPLDPVTKRGPQAGQQQFDSILKFIEDAKSDGNEVLVGGNRETQTGFYLEPTVIAGAAASSRIMREEIFGPVICLNSFTDEEEAVALANDSEFGLYASVYTQDISRALRVAKTFESGTVGVNCTSPMMTHDMPFGGVKQSGEGKELGIAGVLAWTELKTIYIAI